MTKEITARAFGPGFPGEGKDVRCSVSPHGLELATENEADGRRPWDMVTLTQGGWDHKQVRIEWQGNSGRYALMVSGTNAQVVALVLPTEDKIAPAHRDKATARWSAGMLALSLGLPLGVLAMVLVVLFQGRWFAEKILSRVSPETERSIGSRVFEAERARMKMVSGGPLQMVQDIGGRLTTGSRYRYEFFVIADKTVNAFALPGGIVVVHSGLLKMANSAEEVAGVLAHEVAHAEGRHGLLSIARTVGLTTVIALLFGEAPGAGVTGELLGLRFSREQETQADEMGVARLANAGISAYGLRAFFARLAERSGDGPAFLSTHPASSERVAAIDRMLAAQKKASYTPLSYDRDYPALVKELDASFSP